MRNNTVIVLGGPTASGKSGVAAALAELRDGIVINADSMQLYGALPILSAAPTADLLQRAPHRLYGILPPDQTTSAAAWSHLARQEIATALAESKLPIVVGGTGLYLEALVEGLSDIPPIPTAIHATAQDELQAMGNLAFHARLAAADPVSTRLAPGDSQRILRAWEVLQATGLPLSDWQTQRIRDDRCDYLCLAIVPPRDELYAACNERFRLMIEQGALEEIKALLHSGGSDWPVMRTLGAQPLLQHVQGSIDLETAIALGQAATRHYAKRQTTWFRNRYRQRCTARIFADAAEVLTAI